MISLFSRHSRKAAFMLLLLMVIEMVLPLQVLGLTSGPTQPESQGFQSIGSSDMVDLASGDFKYNIPLMDVGGYPINISYSAGSGLEDEASWVGFGWTLNAGTVNRHMKALPDDFNGDEVQKEINLKQKVKIGAAANFKPDIFGWEILGKGRKKMKVNAEGTGGKKGILGFKASLYKDNYYGWSAGVGINASFEIMASVGGLMSTDLGVTSSSRDGAGISPAINLSYASSNHNLAEKVGINLGFDYNSRQGMQSQQLGISFNRSKRQKDQDHFTGGSSGLPTGVSFVDNGVMTYTPTVDVPRNTEAGTYSFHYGLELFGVKGVMGIDGSYSIESIPEQLKIRKLPSYGYLYAHANLKNPNSEAIVDLNREMDIPYFKGTPAIPVPILTNDNFVLNSHNGSGQFKFMRPGSGMGHDSYSKTLAKNTSIGGDLAVGNTIEKGAHFYRNEAFTVTKKWMQNNHFSLIGDYKAPDFSNPSKQHAFFKRIGEMTESDGVRRKFLSEDKAVRLHVGKGTLISNPVAFQGFANADNALTSVTQIETTARDKRSNMMSYLTASEASRYGLDKFIYSYFPVGAHSADCNSIYQRERMPRVNANRKGHHISEISVLDNNGMKMVFGIPVYNITQEEVSFNIGPHTTNDGLCTYNVNIQPGKFDNSIHNKKGRDNYFSKDIIPPYATSFLLTGILSPDYRDLKNDGITDDDHGNAVKFNYTKLSGLYKWRTPFEEGKANYHKRLYADEKDDKANYTYGEKEIWYMHSIESKTMVAVFYLNDDSDPAKQRKDGRGVAGRNGGLGTMRLRKLDSIALYSKPDLKLYGNKATPIKVVHFEYDYSIGHDPLDVNRHPNSVAEGGGKLTLKRIYFTYGKNQKGKSEPYEFNYKLGYTGVDNVVYGHMQSDRWGTFKPNNAALGNNEFPYTDQENVTDGYAGVFNLEMIRLPSGGEIRIEYESDDYAFVQDKRACRMFKVAGYEGSNFIYANAIIIKTESALTAEEQQRLIKGVKFLYGKFYVRLRVLKNREIWDYVPGYAEINAAENVTPVASQNPGEFCYRIPIKLVRAEGLKPNQLVNPFAVGAWQFLRNNLPQHAFPGYEDGTAGVSDIGANLIAAIKALGKAITNYTELFENFNSKFCRIQVSDVIDGDKSWVRLVEPSYKRKGGGHRVRKVTIRDNWQSMTGYDGAEYGQIYEYTMEEDGVVVSSGVASYEPGIGSDENPFKIPVFYSKKIKWGLDYNTYLEEPVGESYMPAPSVVYRKVTVKSFGANASQGPSQDKIGYTEHEFFTAKDFPTRIEKVGPHPIIPDPRLIITLVVSVSRSQVVTSQGISVVQNDMHGKPKATKTFDKGGYLLSSIEYTYQTKDAAARGELSNEVSLLRSNGSVERGVIGEDIEFYSDMREQHTFNDGIRAGIYGGKTSFLVIIPFGGINIGGNTSYAVFNSASVVKVVSRYGILVKTTKMEHGSKVSTENLMWDGETGEVLLTKSNNEFEKPVYHLTYPAHWVYDGMGAAYRNLDAVLTQISTDGTGSLNGNPAPKLAMLSEGDELIDIGGNETFWVITDPNNSANKYLIDRAGFIRTGLVNRTFKVKHSGRRNLSATGIARITSLRNPVVNGRIQVNTETQVIDAAAVVFSDEWGVPVANHFVLDESMNGCTDCECFRQFLFAAAGTRLAGGKPGLLATVDEGASAGSFMQHYNAAVSGPCIDNFYAGQNAFENLYFLETLNNHNVILNQTTGQYTYKLQAGDVGYLGGKKVTYVTVSNQFNQLLNLSGGSNAVWSELFSGCKYRVQSVFGSTGCTYRVYYDANCGYGLIGEDDPESLSNSCSLTPPGELILEVHVESPIVYMPICADPVMSVLNPYFAGIKGVWKPQKSYVYQVDRTNSVPAVSNATSNISRDGYFKSFDPFITFGLNSVQQPLNGLSADRWVWSQRSKYFTVRGEELETVDALNRYSAAIFGYRQTLPVAVAQNARHLSIYSDGFEDYYLDANGVSSGSCVSGPCGLYSLNQFYIKNKILSPSTYFLDNTVSHSGRYSLKIKSNAVLTLSTALNHDKYTSLDDEQIVSRNANKEFVLNNNYLGKGFTPEANKDYILSFWIRDPKVSNPVFAPKMNVSINGSAQDVSSQKWPFVEGWKRIELKFNSGNASQLEIQFTATADVHIDDLRIFPAAAQIKTFSYDAVSLRLMAELDENNFATFYEYNDEGSLTRVKKETDRGIMTIKESRQYIIKQN